MVSSSPGWPGLARRGARLVDDLKWALPKPPLPPLASSARVARARQIGEQRLLVLGKHLRSRRHMHDHVCAAGAGSVLAHAGAAVLGLEMLLVAIVDQRVEIGDALRPHIAALAAVAAVGPAELDELLAPETDAAGAAVARANVDFGLIQELHEPPARPWVSFCLAACAGHRTLSNRERQRRSAGNLCSAGRASQYSTTSTMDRRATHHIDARPIG